MNWRTLPEENRTTHIKKELVLDISLVVNHLGIKLGGLSNDIFVESMWVGYKSINGRQVNVYVHEVSVFLDTDDAGYHYIDSILKHLGAKQFAISGAISMQIFTENQNYYFSDGVATGSNSPHRNEARFRFEQFTIG